MKRFSCLLFFVSLFGSQAKAHDKQSWVYFDLGDTIVNTKNMKQIKYMNGAREYIEELKREGFKIGIISNIPEEWGMDYAHKLLTLKKVIQDGWSEAQPFDWDVYDEIILPLKNTELKPAPTLFIKAIKRAESCPSMYVGESPKEITAATNLGMAAKLFVEQDNEPYLPVDQVRSYLTENYKLEYDQDCI